MKQRNWDLSSAALHILAMALMLCDHLWATVVPGNAWMTAVGRLAFPIFAFMIAEGYFHTSNHRKYAQRLLIFALLSEIPFNLMCGGSLLYPFHQNVLWTLLMGLGLIHWNEKAKESKLWRRILRGAASVAVGFIAGFLTMVDYYGVGVVTVLVFYFFRGRKWWCFLGQAAALYYLNVEILGGLYFEVSLLGQVLQIQQQGLALLALIPIWLYRGRQGLHSRWFRWVCYGFYPVHMLLLYLAMALL
jgi:hypothetical protein